MFSWSFTKIEWVCVALLGLKASPQAGQGKMKISVYLLRSPWLNITGSLLVVNSFDRQIWDNVAMVAVFKNILLQIAHDRSNASDF